MSTLALIDNFRHNLKDACKAKGISQADLARETGLHWVTISRILNGHLNPTLETCEKLAMAAGERADAIFLQPVEKVS